ncbi:protein translocase subunit SecD [Candidatus Parcubacteria bacterium]|nr:MAG: protein translocase subunit SecD [Candidatus Parcubacteria bacterium]
MVQKRLAALAVLLIGLGIGYFVYASQTKPILPFKLGLDLSGGTQLVYRADVSNIPGADVADSMAALRDTIERRVNMFGVSEPLVETQTGGGVTGTSEQRLLVELPGITDTQKAIELIGQTPVLEFRLVKADVESIPPDAATSSIDQYFEPAAITGKDLQSAQLQFQGQTGALNQAVVVLKFNAEGTRIFADVTKNNIGRPMAIFLDGVVISAPIIQDSIPDGTAIVSGNFTPEAAKELARNLNYGALPVSIELMQTQTVSATLGAEAVTQGIMAGLVGVIAVMIFMTLWYRLPGLLASVALLVYIAVMLALFMLIPVTLTAAGIAAFILSVGMAVDANILIFERTREELQSGKTIEEAIADGFGRAWPSIRDSNISSIITAVILFWFGTSLIKGFALVFGLGVIVSMLTAITVSRTFLKSLGIRGKTGLTKFFFSSGFGR